MREQSVVLCKNPQILGNFYCIEYENNIFARNKSRDFQWDNLFLFIHIYTQNITIKQIRHFIYNKGK